MKLMERLVSLYAPLQCVGCGTEGAIMCPNCLVSMPVPDECCYRCYGPSRVGRTCADCRPASGLVSANAATIYEGVAKDLVWRLKFGRVQSAADCMANRLARVYGAKIADDMVIVPVPTANRRVRGRGYDQAVLLAKALARRTPGRYASLLVRQGSQEQIGASRQQRAAQLARAFAVRRPIPPNTRILLIDDVMTTGATMEAAAAVLRAAGARTVGALAFARVL